MGIYPSARLGWKQEGITIHLPYADEEDDNQNGSTNSKRYGDKGSDVLFTALQIAGTLLNVLSIYLYPFSTFATLQFGT